MKQLLTLIAVVVAALTATAQPMLVGHRGSQFGVESTEEAFRNGAARGYHYLETDIKVTRDKRFVLSHDDNTTRLGGKLTIASSSLEELQQETLTQTRGGVTYTGRIMSLEEMLNLCEELDVKPVLELKWATGVNSNDCSNIPLLIEKIEYYGFRNKCIILTSMKPCLEYIRANYPDIELQFLTGEFWASHFDWCVEKGIDADIQAGFFDQSTVEKYHRAGLKVNMWTTNDEAGYRKYAEWGCDFITTDRLDGHNLPIIVPLPPEPEPQPVELVWERLWIRSASTGDDPEHIDGTNAQQGTAVDGLFYVNDCADRLLYVFREGECLGSLPGGEGWGCCRDQAGNIIVRNDKLAGNTHSFIVYRAGATPDSPGRSYTFEVDVPVAGQTNFINAAGDVLSEEGGRIYLYPNKATAANIIEVSLGSPDAAVASAPLMMEGSAAGYIVPTENSRVNWYYQIRNKGIYYYRGEASDEFSAGSGSTNPPSRNSTGGMAVFKIKDNRIFIHNSGANYKGGFTVRNQSRNRVIATVDPIGRLGYEAGGNYSTFNWLIAEPRSDHEWIVYQYCPSGGMAAYRLYDSLSQRIDSPEAATLSHRISGGILRVTGTDPAERVTAFDIAGVPVARGTAQATDLSSVSRGLYVVAVAGKTLKIKL